MFGGFSQQLWHSLGHWGWIYALVFYVIHALALHAIAGRTGEGPKWWAWAPLLNFVLLAKVSRFPVILLLLALIPVCLFKEVGFILFVVMWCMTAARLQKPWWVGLGMLFPVLHLLVPMYLAGSESPA